MSTLITSNSSALGIKEIVDSNSAFYSGGSVIAMKYKNGILIGADTQIAYGHGKRMPSSSRIICIDERTVITASGSHADLQYLAHIIKEINDEYDCYYEKRVYSAKEYFKYIKNILFNRRLKINPLYLNVVIAGCVSSNNYFLGKIDIYGTAITDDFITTGISNYFAISNIRNEYKPTQNYNETEDLMIRSFKILSGLDCCSSQQFQFVKIENNQIHNISTKIIKPHYKCQNF